MGSIPTSDTAERSLSHSERNLNTASVVVSVWVVFRPQIQPNAACPVRNVTSKRRVWSSQYGKHSDLRYSRTQPVPFGTMGSIPTSDTAERSLSRSERNLKTAVWSLSMASQLGSIPTSDTAERSLSHSERNLNTASVVVSVWEAFRPQIQPNAACPVRNVTSKRRVWSSQYGKHSDLRYSRTQPVPFGT
ncbi:hypothetical protein J6590_039966 [Homalodisca vitripennis]|nr:hypothetical protein J6590_039966 [Homalodisca vitripennis]